MTPQIFCVNILEFSHTTGDSTDNTKVNNLAPQTTHIFVALINICIMIRQFCRLQQWLPTFLTLHPTTPCVKKYGSYLARNKPIFLRKTHLCRETFSCCIYHSHGRMQSIIAHTHLWTVWHIKVLAGKESYYTFRTSWKNSEFLGLVIKTPFLM